LIVKQLIPKKVQIRSITRNAHRKYTPPATNKYAERQNDSILVVRIGFLGQQPNGAVRSQDEGDVDDDGKDEERYNETCEIREWLFGEVCLSIRLARLEIGNEEGGCTRMILVVILPNTNVIVKETRINPPFSRTLEYGLESHA
jgi:hypothetical protein